jgi:hypothetical protein
MRNNQRVKWQVTSHERGRRTSVQGCIDNHKTVRVLRWTQATECCVFTTILACTAYIPGYAQHGGT